MYSDYVQDINATSKSQYFVLLCFTIVWLSLPVFKGLLMRVPYPKLRNIVHPISLLVFLLLPNNQKVQVGKDQEKAQSEKDSHSKNRGGKKPN